MENEVQADCDMPDGFYFVCVLGTEAPPGSPDEAKQTAIAFGIRENKRWKYFAANPAQLKDLENKSSDGDRVVTSELKAQLFFKIGCDLEAALNIYQDLIDLGFREAMPNTITAVKVQE